MPEKRKEFLRPTLAEILASFPTEERIEGLTPEERLKGLSVEEQLKALTPEAREALLRQTKQNGSTPNAE